MPCYEQVVKSIHIVNQYDAYFIYILSTTAKLITFLFKTLRSCLKLGGKLSKSGFITPEKKRKEKFGKAGFLCRNGFFSISNFVFRYL